MSRHRSPSPLFFFAHILPPLSSSSLSLSHAHTHSLTLTRSLTPIALLHTTQPLTLTLTSFSLFLSHSHYSSLPASLWSRLYGSEEYRIFMLLKLCHANYAISHRGKHCVFTFILSYCYFIFYFYLHANYFFRNRSEHFFFTFIFCCYIFFLF